MLTNVNITTQKNVDINECVYVCVCLIDDREVDGRFSLVWPTVTSNHPIEDHAICEMRFKKKEKKWERDRENHDRFKDLKRVYDPC